MTNADYDQGYRCCPRFWGETPAQAVMLAIEAYAAVETKCALDLGCGDGKNAAALAQAGFRVVAIDASEIAVHNAMHSFPNAPVSWLVSDLTEIQGPSEAYDVVVATGSLHCLASTEAIEKAVVVMQRMTRKSGLNILASFNDGPQDMRGHDESFKPILLAHARYMEMYRDWTIVMSSNTVQTDRHPHNLIDHSHSITRLVARRTQ